MQNILKLMQIFYVYCSSQIKGDKQEYEFMNHNTHFLCFPCHPSSSHCMCVWGGCILGQDKKFVATFLLPHSA